MFYKISHYRKDSILQCPVCGYVSFFENLVTYSSENLNRDYVNCSCCGLVFSDPLTVPNYEDSESEYLASYNYKCYVDIGAGIESMIRPLIAIITNRLSDLDSFLDVGCGFGYCVKFASTIMRMRSVGYEPGGYGKIGAKVMGINIINEYFQSGSSKNKYSVVFSSEVIEHIADPCSYLETLVMGLKKYGIAVLTTPNADYLHQCIAKNEDSDLKALALLNPGQHLCLFNQESMIFALKKVGISNFRIVEEDASLIVYFSKDRNLDIFNLPSKSQLRSYFLDFLKHLLEGSIEPRKLDIWNILRKFPYMVNNSSDDGSPYQLVNRFRLGIAYRLMREFVNDGNFIRAREIKLKYEILYEKCFQKTVYEALQCINSLDIKECISAISVMNLFSEKRVSFNLYSFLFYSVNLALNDGKVKENIDSSLVSVVKNTTDVLLSIFETLRTEPIALTWFGEQLGLYPRFCFGLAVLYIHLDRNQEALILLDRILAITNGNDFEFDSRLKFDCLLQKAVIFLRNKDLTNFFSCINTLTSNHLEFSNSSELLSTLLSKSEEIYL